MRKHDSRLFLRREYIAGKSDTIKESRCRLVPWKA